jgi:LPS-assembly protein
MVQNASTKETPAPTPAAVAELPRFSPVSAPVTASAIPHPATTPFSATDKKSAPTIVTAQHIKGVNEVEMVAEGDAVLQRAGDTLLADRLIYREADDEVEAIGNVRLTSPDTSMTGPRLRMRMEESTGEFETPVYSMKRQPPAVPEAALTMSGLPAVDMHGHVLAKTGKMILPPPVTGSGEAKLLEFRGEDQYHLENATYSTCAPGQRDWKIGAAELDLDYSREVGSASNALVTFMDVPIFYSPWMSFSLSDQRKSGLLAPSIGSTTASGFEVSTPWYWNIAPDMDATITPRVLSKRGVQLNTEFRYLLDTPVNRAPGTLLPDKGLVRLEYLPSDNQANRDRYAYSVMHNQFLGHGFTGMLNVSGVSDSNYYSDLSTRITAVSQGNLLRQGVLSYAGPWYTAALNVQTYQTLQNAENFQDLPKPYERLPQLTGTAFRYDLPAGLAFTANAEYVDFNHPTYLLGKRTTLYPQLSLPLTTAAFSLTPKVGIHATHYELDGQDRPGALAWNNGQEVPASQSRTVPIFSVDGGFFMERDTEYFGGRSLVQTLEPRAYYLYVPVKDQRDIPVFDTGIAGFTYAQMFSENRYAGGDRIGDANQLTLAVTSRLIDPAGGEELLRATLGTRYYFSSQSDQVFLPGETIRTEQKADILAAFIGQILPKTYADFAWQYNPRDSQTERFAAGGRYRPEAGKIFNAAYRYDRNNFDQIDVSGQWPISGGWHAVGRYNYSLEERRVIETIAGLEYNAGCWVGRAVVQRIATIADQPNDAFFFQLELNDFTSIGSNPLQILRRNIPGYGRINQAMADPVFAE